MIQKSHGVFVVHDGLTGQPFRVAIGLIDNDKIGKFKNAFLIP